MNDKRRATTINLSPDEILALRRILLAQSKPEPMAEFFAKYARQYIAEKTAAKASTRKSVDVNPPSD